MLSMLMLLPTVLAVLMVLVMMLPTVLAVLEVMGVTEVEGDHVTSETVANAAVRWRPASPTGGVGIPGRSVLEGASLLLPGVATTDSSGAFVIETNQFGGGSVSLQKNPSQAVMTTAVAGQTKNGLELRQ